jgi:hypothetical protein
LKYIIKKYLVICLLFLALVGSSGESNDSTPSTHDDGFTYDLTNIWTKHNYSFYMKVTSSANNDEFLYSMSTTRQPDTIINGINVKHLLITGTFTNKTTGEVESMNQSNYYDNNGISIQSIIDNNKTICTINNTPTPLKPNTKIGDSGVGSNLTCTDGTSVTNVWTLIKVNNATVFEEVVNEYDSKNNLLRTRTDRYTIDTSQTIKKYSSIIYDVNNEVTITFIESDAHIRL